MMCLYLKTLSECVFISSWRVFISRLNQDVSLSQVLVKTCLYLKTLSWRVFISRLIPTCLYLKTLSWRVFFKKNNQDVSLFQDFILTSLYLRLYLDVSFSQDFILIGFISGLYLYLCDLRIYFISPSAFLCPFISSICLSELFSACLFTHPSFVSLLAYLFQKAPV